jgi:hypothetical protein
MFVWYLGPLKSDDGLARSHHCSAATVLNVHDESSLGQVFQLLRERSAAVEHLRYRAVWAQNKRFFFDLSLGARGIYLRAFQFSWQTLQIETRHEVLDGWE